MTLTQENILKLNNDIEQNIDSQSQYYGRLIEWQEGFTNHYGLGLCDNCLFSPGEIFSIIKIEGLSWKLTPTKSLAPEVVINRLIYSLDCFKDWHYGLLGWNCEHYSRLIATNVALSYQVMYSPLAILNHGGYHPTAVKLFREYLEKLELRDLVE